LSLTDRVNSADAAYPPPGDRRVQEKNWKAWLFLDGSNHMVALKDEEVVGHIAWDFPHDYITDHLEPSENSYLEITQFFVDPTLQREGIGDKLFQSVLQEARRLNSKVALVALDGSDAAKRFYLHHGLREISKFTGRDGVNTIFVED
jgi:GNAT superfamily N-acetyltransferase